MAKKTTPKADPKPELEVQGNEEPAQESGETMKNTEPKPEASDNEESTEPKPEASDNEESTEPKPEASDNEESTEPAQESGADDKKDVLTPEEVDDEEPNPESDEKALVPVNQDNTPPALLTDEQIDEAVNEINNIVGKNLLQTALEIGEYVLKKFFEDDIEKAKSHAPNKDVSFRKLEKRNDMVIRFSKLCLTVNLAIQERELRKQLENQPKPIQIENLHYSHRVELLKVKDEAKKVELVEKCVENDYTVETLRNVIKSIGKRKPKDTADPLVLKIGKLNSLLGFVAKNYLEIKVKKATFSGVSAAKKASMLTKCNEVLIDIGKLKTKIDDIKSKLDAQTTTPVK